MQHVHHVCVQIPVVLTIFTYSCTTRLLPFNIIFLFILCPLSPAVTGSTLSDVVADRANKLAGKLAAADVRDKARNRDRIRDQHREDR